MVAEGTLDILSDSSVVSLSAGVTGQEVLPEEPGLVTIRLFVLGVSRLDVDWCLIAFFPLLTCSFLGDAKRFPRASEGGLAVSP